MQHSTANTILTTSTKQLIKACSIKLLYDSLPTYLTLNKRGIPVASTCPLCDVEDESISHLFLFCPFARATWHGSPLAVHTPDLHNTSIQQWIGTILLKHKKMDQDMMHYLQAVFTTLWTIWTHRNLVVHEGKHPNPVEVILTAQSLTCRYQEAFSSCSSSSNKNADQNRALQRFGGPWQLIIKVAGVRKKKARRCGFAYEAKNTSSFKVSQAVQQKQLPVPSRKQW